MKGFANDNLQGENSQGENREKRSPVFRQEILALQLHMSFSLLKVTTSLRVLPIHPLICHIHHKSHQRWSNGCGCVDLPAYRKGQCFFPAILLLQL